MSWITSFLGAKWELFSSLSESKRSPNEPDSDPDFWRAYNIWKLKNKYKYCEFHNSLSSSVSNTTHLLTTVAMPTKLDGN